MNKKIFTYSQFYDKFFSNLNLWYTYNTFFDYSVNNLVHNWNLNFLFLNQNIYYGYLKNPLSGMFLLSTEKQMLKLMNKKIFTILQ